MMKKIYDAIYKEINTPDYDFNFEDTRQFMILKKPDRFDEQKDVIKRVADKLGMTEQSLTSYLLDVSFNHIKSFKRLEELTF